MSSNVFQKPLDNMEKIHVEESVRVRLVGTEPFFGPGVAHLMELIEQCGSVAGACDRMGLSYSKGRTMLRRLERETGFPSVDRSQGGAGGGSTRLTGRGKKLLYAYLQYERDIKASARAHFARAFAEFTEWEETP